MRHTEESKNVPMYITNRPCESAGPFRGNLVVSMRPLLPGDVPRATAITRRFPRVHGAPVHVGAPITASLHCLACRKSWPTMFWPKGLALGLY